MKKLFVTVFIIFAVLTFSAFTFIGGEENNAKVDCPYLHQLNENAGIECPYLNKMKTDNGEGPQLNEEEETSEEKCPYLREEKLNKTKVIKIKSI